MGKKTQMNDHWCHLCRTCSTKTRPYTDRTKHFRILQTKSYHYTLSCWKLLWNELSGFFTIIQSTTQCTLFTIIHSTTQCTLSNKIKQCIYTVSQEETSIFWKVTVSVILSKNSIRAWPIPNGFRDRAISLYSCKTVDKEILHNVSNISIYCSSDKVGTVYPVRYIFENSTVNIRALSNSCEDMACCWSECILTFHCVGDNIHCEIERFASCIHFCSVHFTFQPNPKTKI
jgi:hypothetical protein